MRIRRCQAHACHKMIYPLISKHRCGVGNLFRLSSSILSKQRPHALCSLSFPALLVRASTFYPRVSWSSTSSHSMCVSPTAKTSLETTKFSRVALIGPEQSSTAISQSFGKKKKKCFLSSMGSRFEMIADTRKVWTRCRCRHMQEVCLRAGGDSGRSDGSEDLPTWGPSPQSDQHHRPVSVVMCSITRSVHAF
jgi:hypothetical protein